MENKSTRKGNHIVLSALIALGHPMPLVALAAPAVSAMATEGASAQDVAGMLPPRPMGQGETIIKAGETLATLNDWRAILYGSLLITFCLIGGLFSIIWMFLRTSNKQAEASASLAVSLSALTSSLSELKTSDSMLMSEVKTTNAEVRSTVMMLLEGFRRLESHLMTSSR